MNLEDFCDDMAACPWVLATAGAPAQAITADILQATCLRDWLPSGTGLCGRVVA